MTLPSWPKNSETWFTQPPQNSPFLLLYPDDYSIMAANLGIHGLYHIINQQGFGCDLGFVNNHGQIITYSGKQPSHYKVIGISLHYEMEWLTIIHALQNHGIKYSGRKQHDPLIIAGGPLMAINPLLGEAIADLVVVGEADDYIADIFLEAFNGKTSFTQFINRHQSLTQPCNAKFLHTTQMQHPLQSSFISKNSVFADMFLVEISRGCPYSCHFCSLGHWKQTTRFFPPETIKPPANIKKIGLVGAAVTNHPHHIEIAKNLLDHGHEIHFSSMRVNHITSELLSIIAQSGSKSITLGIDGLSQSLRNSIKKQVSQEQIQRAITMAIKIGITQFKLYTIICLPDEDEQDYQEFSTFLESILNQHKQITIQVALSPFVPKPHTPLSSHSLYSVKAAKQRLMMVKKKLPKRIKLSWNSPKTALLEYYLAHSSMETIQTFLQVLPSQKPIAQVLKWFEKNAVLH